MTLHFRDVFSFLPFPLASFLLPEYLWPAAALPVFSDLHCKPRASFCDRLLFICTNNNHPIQTTYTIVTEIIM